MTTNQVNAIVCLEMGSRKFSLFLVLGSKKGMKKTDVFLEQCERNQR